jgi:peptide/nickel transport system substrate-binding protein
MYNVGMNAPDPQVFMAQFVSWEIASRENKWTGRNPMRFRSDEYDRLWRAAETEMDPVKRAALFIRMNDLVIANVAVIPVLWRNGVGAANTRLHGMELNGWDTAMWRLPYWYKA